MLYIFKKKYNQMAPLARAAFWFTLCGIFQRGIQFLIVPIYTRVLTTTEYGDYSVFISWVEIIQIFCTLNLYYNSFNVGLTKFDNDKNNFTTALVGLSSTITIAFFVVYLVCYKQIASILGMTPILCSLMFVYIFWLVR